VVIMPFLSATVYDKTGLNRIAQLSFSSDKQFVDELKGDGSFSLTLLAEEANIIEIGRIVKFSYGESSDDFVFAGVIEKISRTQTDEQDVVKISGRGIRSLLESALIYTNDRQYVDETVGYIMAELFDEAVARGALGGMTRTFSSTTDSNSASFTANETITLDEKIGTNLAEVANRHQDMAVDIYVAPNMTLNYYINKGTDRTTGTNPLVFRVGESVINYEKTVEGPVKNAAVSVWGDDNTVVGITRGSSISTYGRYETFLSLNNVKDSTSANLITNRTLDITDDPNYGATIELAEEGPQPYLDFVVGDWVTVIDQNGTRDNFRVRAITMSEQDVGAIRVVPELGTARAALEERLRRMIARQEAKTANGFADAAAGAVELNGFGDLGGGADVYDATVLSYDPALGTGTADAPLFDIDPIDFTNGTGIYLGVDDEIIVILKTDNDPATPDEFIAIGVTARSGTVTPVNQPVGTLSTGFPLRTDNLPNPFIPNINTDGGRGAIYDTAGLLGQGADAIIGPEFSATYPTFNGFSRTLASSFALAAPPIGTANQTSYLLADGRIVMVDANNVYVRNVSTGVWTNPISTTSDIEDVAFDYSNGWLWIYTAGATAPAGGPFWSFSSADAAPVARGDLGTGFTVATPQTQLRMAAGDGILAMQYAAPYRYYTKASNSNANFAYTYSTANYIITNQGVAGNAPLEVVTQEGHWYITQYTPSTPDEAAINFFNNSDGTTTTYLTGIEWGTDPRRPYGYIISSTGHHIITCVRNDGGTNRISLASNNLTSTSYIYTDTTRTVNSSDFFGAPYEVSNGVVRFTAHDNFAGAGALNAAYVYEVSLS
jgi:hypothetical protein